jgi:hypothetical protein
VNSEMYSPAQARATSAHEMYSENSHQDKDRANDDASVAVRIMRTQAKAKCSTENV